MHHLGALRAARKTARGAQPLIQSSAVQLTRKGRNSFRMHLGIDAGGSADHGSLTNPYPGGYT